jgi:hypothetical protein
LSFARDSWKLKRGKTDIFQVEPNATYIKGLNGTKVTPSLFMATYGYDKVKYHDSEVLVHVYIGDTYSISEVEQVIDRLLKWRLSVGDRVSMIPMLEAAVKEAKTQ